MLDDERIIYELIYDVQFYTDQLLHRATTTEDLMDIENLLQTIKTLRDNFADYVARVSDKG